MGVRETGNRRYSALCGIASRERSIRAQAVGHDGHAAVTAGPWRGAAPAWAPASNYSGLAGKARPRRRQRRPSEGLPRPVSTNRTPPSRRQHQEHPASQINAVHWPVGAKDVLASLTCARGGRPIVRATSQRATPLVSMFRPARSVRGGTLPTVRAGVVTPGRRPAARGAKRGGSCSGGHHQGRTRGVACRSGAAWRSGATGCAIRRAEDGGGPGGDNHGEPSLEPTDSDDTAGLCGTGGNGLG